MTQNPQELDLLSPVDFRAIERDARQLRAEAMADTGRAILGWLRALTARRASTAPAA